MDHKNSEYGHSSHSDERNRGKKAACNATSKALEHTEVYLEPSRTSMMELLCENRKRLLAVNYFCKKSPS